MNKTVLWTELNMVIAELGKYLNPPLTDMPVVKPHFDKVIGHNLFSYWS